jgi:hypothetical protein
VRLRLSVQYGPTFLGPAIGHIGLTLATFPSACPCNAYPPPVFNEDTMAKIGLIAKHTSHLATDADRHRTDLTGGASGENPV